MASLDTRRPAAQEQLRVLGEQAGVDTLPIVDGQTPVEIAGRAVQAAKLGGYDVVHARHRRPHPYRRRADGRDRRDQGGRQPARNPAGRRRADRPGRGQSRALLRRAGRHHRHRPDPRRRRRARRRGAFDARGHRQADQADRHRRKAGRARGFPSLAHRRPHPRHGRHRRAGRKGRRDDRRRKGRRPWPRS